MAVFTAAAFSFASFAPAALSFGSAAVVARSLASLSARFSRSVRVALALTSYFFAQCASSALPSFSFASVKSL